MFLECISHLSWIGLFSTVANRIIFLILFIQFLHRKLYGTTNWNSLWKSLIVICLALLADSCVRPLFLSVIQFLVSSNDILTLAILLLILELYYNRWFTSNEDQTPVPLESQRSLPEQRAPTICHSQGDVPGHINPKSSRDTEHIGVGNLDPTETIPKVIQSHLQGNVSDRINSNSIDETDYVDVEGLDQTMTRGNEMHNLQLTQHETNTPRTESIAEPGSHISFDVPHTCSKKSKETSQQQAYNLSTNSNLMTLTTRSGRVYYKNRN